MCVTYPHTGLCVSSLGWQIVVRGSGMQAGCTLIPQIALFCNVPVSIFFSFLATPSQRCKANGEEFSCQFTCACGVVPPDSASCFMLPLHGCMAAGHPSSSLRIMTRSVMCGAWCVCVLAAGCIWHVAASVGGQRVLVVARLRARSHMASCPPQHAIAVVAIIVAPWRAKGSGFPPSVFGFPPSVVASLKPA